jgi:hypothetical protein
VVIGNESAAVRPRATIMRDRERIARGECPTYHVSWVNGVDAVEVPIAELTLIHTFVPNRTGDFDGARVLIARRPEVGPTAAQ